MTTEDFPRNRTAGVVSVSSLIQKVADRVGQTHDYDVAAGFNQLTAWMEKLSTGSREIARLPGIPHVPRVVGAIREFAFQSSIKKKPSC